MKRVLLVAVLSLAACGPEEWIVETPGISRPARPSDCNVDLITLGPSDLAPAGPYELLGYLTIARDAVQDPTQPETREKVRARACKMGGEAMAVWDLKTSRASPTAHTEIDYAVVRRAQGAVP
jgi:hypothetical protein